MLHNDRLPRITTPNSASGLASALRKSRGVPRTSIKSPRYENRPILLIDDEANRQEFMEFVHYFVSKDYDEHVARKILQPFREKLTMGRVPLAERIENLLTSMTMNMRSFLSLVSVFSDEMSRGLQANLQNPGFWYPRFSSFKMIDTFLQKLPRGDENGIAYAVHINPLRVKVTRFKMGVNENVSCASYSLHAANLIDPRVSRTQFFDAIVELLQMSMYKHGDLELYFNHIKYSRSTRSPKRFSLYPITLSVAFPIVQGAIDSAVLVEWTGDVKAGRATPEDPIEGTDLVEGFNAALIRCTTPGRVVVFANETVGNLYSAAYDYARQPSSKKEHRSLLLGVVCGVGLDACYVESNAKAHYGYEGSVIDLECGNLDRELPMTVVDHELDGVNPESQGQNLLEKMTAMRYIGEIARRLCTHIFQSKTPPKAWEEGSLSPAQVIAIAEDSSVTKDVAQSVIRDCWDEVPSLDEDSGGLLKGALLYPRGTASPSLGAAGVSEVEIILRCCRAAIDRAAALTAMVAIGVARQSGFLKQQFHHHHQHQHQHHHHHHSASRFRNPGSGVMAKRLGIAVGGQFIESSELFKDRLRHWLGQGMRSVALESSGVDLLQAKDGAGRGLAAVAAVVVCDGESPDFGPSEDLPPFFVSY
eukprot:Protomagalhaensia_sp_Gyna_25__1817@NODE_195_length_4515_cov_24_568141_g150_i0_p1_GENE_NODE_195_length_4515_cov_24_568141_g150_i0NODE_195_length_4515_cov_24_568141_g150_i0_p1_ORF_typecomplete_len646_score119_96Hexokinase_2/PF03727_16/7_7e27Hexokinase_1/PF00349_21/1_1e22DUF1980/PF09323_10/2_3Chorion_2/PF03964_15/4_9_NODE_195_length_4515_cov_24_568141_g150_i020333970